VINIIDGKEGQRVGLSHIHKVERNEENMKAFE
jgi:hypothetical protein